MKSRREPTDKEILDLRIEMARMDAYEPIAYLNREARRTAAGRIKVLEADKRFLQAKIALLEEHLNKEQ